MFWGGSPGFHNSGSLLGEEGCRSGKFHSIFGLKKKKNFYFQDGMLSHPSALLLSLSQVYYYASTLKNKLFILIDGQGQFSGHHGL